MFCTNCGAEVAEGLAFCTNCGTAVNAGRVSAGVAVGEIGASLEAAVQANRDTIDSIESRAQAQVDAAFSDFPPMEGAAAGPEPPAGFAAGQAAAQPGAEAQARPPGTPGAETQTQASAQPGAVPVGAPFYQQDASPSAHYSSQRSYEGDAYGQGTGQPARQQPAYGQPSRPQPSGAATPRAFAMVLYVSGLIGLIIGLCVRDKDDPFITHHLNNVTVLCIASVIGSMLSIVLVGFLVLIYVFVMTIMGMVSAYNGNMDELPLIGKIRIIK